MRILVVSATKIIEDSAVNHKAEGREEKKQGKPRVAMTSLQELYRRYTAIAAKPGEPIPLAAFEWSPGETEKTFSAFDEDYHISRFLHFSNSGGPTYEIDGQTVTHVAIDPEISSIL
jgi:hypothetical protein